jgi:hypothetical protein
LAPRTFEAPEPYDELPTPTLLIRKTGEAWNEPFVVVFEPFDENSNSIDSIEKIKMNGLYKGLKVISKIKGKKLVQYIITQSENQVFIDEKTDIYFKGTFAIISVNDKNEVLNMYIGEGDELRVGDVILKSEDSKKAAFKDFNL